jgi:type IV secretory pathway VirB10-like protein
MIDRKDLPAQEGQRPLATRAAPPRPRRLSRKAIAGLTGAGAFAIAGALAYSLSDGSHRRDTQENVMIASGQDADALTDAPKDYGDVAQTAKSMGPPAPSPEKAIEPVTDASPAPAAPDPAAAEAERRRQAKESARASKLFAASDGARKLPDEDMAAPAQAKASLPAEARAGNNPVTQNSGRVSPPPGPHVLMAGSTISGALVTGLSSDLPGQVIAQVTEDVFDSATGLTRLIPQGARLLGTYDSKVAFGQDRALVIWNRLIYPDGRSVDLDQMSATDGSGASGLTDRVDNHWGRIIKAGIVATLFGVGTELSEGSGDSTIAEAIRDSNGQTVGRAGDRLVERELEVRPTISIRPGARIRVLVSRDLVLAPT